MKISFFIGSLTGGGAERVCCQLSSYLVNKGYDVNILTVTNTKNNYEIDDRVKISSLDTVIPKALSILRMPIKMLKLPFFLLKNKTDIYVVFLTGTIRAITFYKDLLNAPILISNRNDPSLYPSRLRKQLFAASRKVEGIVCQTIDTKEYYESNVPGKEYYIIPNSISPEFVKYRGERDKRIVSVGRFMDQKNFPLLIKAFNQICREYPDYTLEIYGEGPLKVEYIELCEKLGIVSRVTFPGYVKNVSERIQNASAFVLPSKYEGIPNALMEAMAVGLPCVSTDCKGGGARFLIDNKVNGIIVPNEDYNALAEGIKYILDNPTESEKMGEYASKIHETLSPDTIYSKWEEAILDIYSKWKK